MFNYLKEAQDMQKLPQSDVKRFKLNYYECTPRQVLLSICLKVSETNSTGMTEQLLFSSQGVKTGSNLFFQMLNSKFLEDFKQGSDKLFSNKQDVKYSKTQPSQSSPVYFSNLKYAKCSQRAFIGFENYSVEFGKFRLSKFSLED